MKPMNQWAREVRQLSTLEKVLIKEAIETLFSWKPLRWEFSELDLIRRLLVSELRGTDHGLPAGLRETVAERLASAERSYSRYAPEARPKAVGA